MELPDLIMLAAASLYPSMFERFEKNPALTRRNAVSEALRLHEEAKKQCAQGRYEHS